MVPTLVRVDEVAPVRWRNGGGMTRELLAWPNATDWVVRISVAEITASGPFSEFPGVDRWFAVLSGGAVRLDTHGADAQELGATRTTLHCFSGDVPTHCTALGAATCDFNVMLRRARGRLRQQPLTGNPVLSTTAKFAALFTMQPVVVAAAGDMGCALPAAALAWWCNPQRTALALQARGAADARGWWLEADSGT